MDCLLLFRSDGQQFAVDVIQRLFQDIPGFRNLRINSSTGVAIEVAYGEGEDSIVVELSENLDSISLSDTSDVSLHVALMLQKRLAMPLHIIDLSYSFDLNLQGYTNIEELRTAMENAEEG